MRRTKEQKEFNKKLLLILLEKYKIVGEPFAIIIETDLRGKYIGRLPYTTPTCYDDIFIKQLPKERGSKWNIYSIIKL